MLKDKGEVQLGYPELPVFYWGTGDQLCKWRRSRVWDELTKHLDGDDGSGPQTSLNSAGYALSIY